MYKKMSTIFGKKFDKFVQNLEFGKREARARRARNSLTDNELEYNKPAVHNNKTDIQLMQTQKEKIMEYCIEDKRAQQQRYAIENNTKCRVSPDGYKTIEYGNTCQVVPLFSDEEFFDFCENYFNSNGGKSYDRNRPLSEAQYNQIMTAYNYTGGKRKNKTKRSRKYKSKTKTKAYRKRR